MGCADGVLTGATALPLHRLAGSSANQRDWKVAQTSPVISAACTGSEAVTAAPARTPPRTWWLCPSPRVTVVSALPSASASMATRVPSFRAMTSSEVCSNISVPATSSPTGAR